VKLYSWNINGFRAVLGKGFWDWLSASGADVVGLQEVKAELDQLPAGDRTPPPGWGVAWNHCKVKKGYSGTAAYYRQDAAPLSASTGLPDPAFQGEGRCQLLEYPDFWLFNIYFPNGAMNEERLAYKLKYYDVFLDYAQKLRKTKPVVACGDFNTAHREIDLANPKENEKISGFLPIERAWIDRFIAAGYVDTFRRFEPGPQHYSWWSYRGGARRRNVGWRIDYFFVSEELRDKVKRAWIEPQVQGSDHCPVGLELELP
jgi:exodeoxyribonuclease III